MYSKKLNVENTIDLARLKIISGSAKMSLINLAKKIKSILSYNFF